ncbi:Serine protease [Trichuris trichiura]|uniref:Serine protease n=1 Tax=Trichuris trichiura TaxID=36087 RepID=A0A077ZIN5_TRITR|nr:Serine protease [Trichuris trichiura]
MSNVGGWDAYPHSIPWQVRLYLYYDGLTPRYCGGSLIRLDDDDDDDGTGNQTRYYNTRPRNIEVLFGAHNVNFYEEKREAVVVKKYNRGPYDHETKEEGIALLYLRKPVTFTDTIMPVCLPESNAPLPKNASCYISGWGSTVNGGSPSNTLQMVDVNILEHKDCDIDKKTMAKSFCAGNKEGGKDACQEAESTHDVECGLPKHSFIRNGDNRIVGGWEALPHSVPWQVRLHMYDNDRLDGSCGGSLVRLKPGNSTRFVLTAAHCVRHNKRKEYRSPKDIEAVVGAHNFQFFEFDRVVSGVEKFTHGQYSHKSKRLDIALILLRRTITFTDTIMPVCLPKSREPLPKDVPCYISGWGSIVSGDSPSYTLQVVDVNILKDEDCDIDEETRAKSFCAGHKEGGKDACQGDSGGPLVCIVNDRFFLYGITSYGEGCGQRGKPGVYSEVAQYIHWIKRQAPLFNTKFDLFTDSIYQGQNTVEQKSVSSETF